MIAAVVDEIDILFLQARHQGGEIFLTGGDPVEEDHVCPAFFQAILHRTGQTFAVLLFVMYHCDTLRLHFAENVFRRGWPLIGVQTGGAQDQLIAARRQFRSSRCRGNHQNAFVFIDIRRRLSGRGTQVTNNVFDAVVDHFVGYRYRLFRVASVIIFDDLQLIALDAALSVDIRYRLLCAGKLLVAVLGHRAGHRPDYRDFDIFRQRRAAHN